MNFFRKDYWFSSPKGYFRVRIIEGDVLMEASPNNFVSSKDLWMTRPEFQQTRDSGKRTLIRLKHLDEYNKMLDVLSNCKEEEEQATYIKNEMKAQGYFWVRTV